MPKFRTVASLILLAAVASPSLGSEKLDVVLIEVPVHVVDRNGTPVRDLTADNFEILDEGKKRPITHFETIDLTRLTPKARQNPFNPVARRNFLLVFDLTYSSPGTVERAAQAAGDFIRKGMSELDLVGVATYSVESGIRWVTAFTGDRGTLLKSVAAIGAAARIQATDPLLLAVTTGEGVRDSPRGERQRSIAEAQAEINQRIRGSDEDLQRTRIRQQLDHFGRLARALDRLRGQKQVILLSEGFDARLLQGREATSQSEDAADFAAVVQGEVWKVDNDQRFGNTATASVLDQMAGLFKRSDVVLHTFDIKGLRTDVDAREGRKISSTESLFLLSNPTGGQVFKNSNDLGENFERMLRQQQIMYVLGFQVASPGNPGKFHNLKVRLRDVPGARPFHRTGYYEPSADSSLLERNLSAAEILMNDIPQEGVTLDMMAAPFPAEIGNPQVGTVVEIGGSSLLEGAGEGTVDVEVFLYAFDRDYAVRDFLYQKIGLDLSKVRARLESAGVKFYGAMNLPAGDYEIKALVRNPSGNRIGFRRLHLNVPDFTQATFLPPLFIEDQSDWITVKAAPRRPAEVDYPFVIASEMFLPRAARRLSESRAYEVAVFGYHIEPEGLQLSVKVRDESGAELPASVVLVGRSPSGAKGPTKLLFNFKPAGLRPGSYQLDFHLRPRDQVGESLVSAPFVIN